MKQNGLGIGRGVTCDEDGEAAGEIFPLIPASLLCEPRARPAPTPPNANVPLTFVLRAAVVVLPLTVPRLPFTLAIAAMTMRGRNGRDL